MKFLVVLSVVVALAAAAPSGPNEYLLAYDFDSVFGNDAQRKVVFDCLLDKGPCGEYETLKDSVTKVGKTQCADCNAEQKAKYDNVMKTFHDKYEATYTEFITKLATKA